MDSSSKRRRKDDVEIENKPSPPPASAPPTVAAAVQGMISPEAIKAMMNQAKAHITQRKQDLHIKVGLWGMCMGRGIVSKMKIHIHD